ncbi:aldo/keto reductase [Rhodococcus sp. T7]|uniref:aldo/keto reductase n=1 Tax=Rhodococcus sp. T7 TaxID=627444 RepID=UPI001358F819|nr:aldo/keto reductase [Rhodococcus sp. T7]KAF0956952.1 Aldo-keto reductase IolS [Rhodococcus sp. T7]KAF0963338.1 Aldo-keto reductase IolS [Rhodococcus sp. T7]
MRTRKLGTTGMEVSAFCLGAMMFGGANNADHGSCVRATHAALDRGINFVDTADMYSDGESEEIVGKALAGRRDDVILATKFHFPMGEGPNRGGNSRRWIMRAVEDSLRRLDTDWIDLYQVHRPDESTDIDDTLSALTDLVRAGKIRAFGCSSFPPEFIVDAHHVATTRGYERFRTEQPPYSIMTRGAEASVFPICEKYGMGTLTWAPLASGFLTGKYRKGKSVNLSVGRAARRPAQFDPTKPETVVKLNIVEKLVEIADSIGCTLPHLAVAFAASHPAVSSVIVGPRNEDQLLDLVEGADLVLSDEVLDLIDDVVAPGIDIYPPGGRFQRAVLKETSRRRRPIGDRGAAA